jgi:hypothetical protein
MRKMLLLLPLVAAAGLFGCATEPVLVPGPGASQPAGAPQVAFADVSGVRLWANGDAWQGTPSSLEQVLTPVQVTLENHSGQPIRIAYKDFTLLGGTGFRYAALPPFSMQGTAVSTAEQPGAYVPAAFRPSAVSPLRPRFRSDRFLVARPYVGFYPGFSAWPYGWEWDPFYYDRWYASWPTPLPTRDMLEEALPEGVVEDGGRISGFIYFQQTTREQQVQLQFQATDAKTGQVLGTGSVPFVVVRRRG